MPLLYDHGDSAYPEQAFVKLGISKVVATADR